MLLNIEKSGEQGKERSKEWLVKTDPGLIEFRPVSLCAFRHNCY